MVGDIPFLIGGDILGTFRKLRRKHGDIFSFFFGKDLTIVINGYNSIQKAAVQKGGIFSGRPNIFVNDILGEGKGLIFATGDFWKRHRKFTSTCLQEFGFGKSSLERHILKEVRCFVDVIEAKTDEPFDIKKSIHASIANIIFAIVSGKRHEYDDEFYQKLLTDSELAAKKVIQVSILISCAPFLQYIPGDPLQFNTLRKNRKNWDDYIMKMYEEHKNELDENNPRDFIDSFIIEMRRQKQITDHSEFSLDQLKTTVRDLFGAGSETTATTIRWAILYLLKHPDIKQRLQSDIDNVISDSELPCLDDKVKLPYVEAFIMEVLRLVNIAPLAVPHSVSTENDVTFEGYRIPKDSSIIFNLDSVLKDPDMFENPEQFDPGRFLNSAGNVTRPKEFIPFGIGRRVCLGEAVAKMELFLFLTSLIKHFDILVAEDDLEPDLVGVLGITYSPKPYKVRMIKRTSF